MHRPPHLTRFQGESCQDRIGVCVRWGGAVLLKSQESCFEFREVALRAGVPGILGTSQGPPSSLNRRVAN